MVVSSLARALREREALVRERLGALLHDDYDWYTALRRRAPHRRSIRHYVPAGVEAAIPIRVFHWLDGARRVVAPRTVIVLERGAKATVIEEQLSETAEGPPRTWAAPRRSWARAHGSCTPPSRTGGGTSITTPTSAPVWSATASCSGSRHCSAAG